MQHVEQRPAPDGLESLVLAEGAPVFGIDETTPEGGGGAGTHARRHRRGGASTCPTGEKAASRRTLPPR